MHLFNAEVVRVGDVEVLCVDLAEFRNMLVLMCVEMTRVRVLLMLNPGVFKLTRLNLGAIAIVFPENGK
eukprot:7892604-Prorocentrum_lima.AAC.1